MLAEARSGLFWMISAQKSEIKLAKRTVMGSLRNAGDIILKQPEYELAHVGRDAEAIADALATIRSFNLRLQAGRLTWFWPAIAAALAMNIIGPSSPATPAAPSLTLI
jgi:hypothetical protein